MFPAIAKKEGGFTYFEDEHGIPIGTMPGLDYEKYTLTLEKGDTLNADELVHHFR